MARISEALKDDLRMLAQMSEQDRMRYSRLAANRYAFGWTDPRGLYETQGSPTGMTVTGSIPQLLEEKLKETFDESKERFPLAAERKEKYIEYLKSRNINYQLYRVWSEYSPVNPKSKYFKKPRIRIKTEDKKAGTGAIGCVYGAAALLEARVHQAKRQTQRQARREYRKQQLDDIQKIWANINKRTFEDY